MYFIHMRISTPACALSLEAVNPLTPEYFRISSLAMHAQVELRAMLIDYDANSLSNDSYFELEIQFWTKTFVKR